MAANRAISIDCVGRIRGWDADVLPKELASIHLHDLPVARSCGRPKRSSRGSLEVGINSLLLDARFHP